MNYLNQYYYFSFSVCLVLPVAFIPFINFPWWWSFPFRRDNMALLFSIALFHLQHTQWCDGDIESFSFTTAHAEFVFKTPFWCFNFTLLLLRPLAASAPCFYLFITVFYNILYIACEHKLNWIRGYYSLFLIRWGLLALTYINLNPEHFRCKNSFNSRNK